MKTTYQPISCDFYDHIEIFAMRKTTVAIEYRDNTGAVQRLSSRILDTKVANKEEFILLENGREIRMDRLLKINEIEFPQGIKGC